MESRQIFTIKARKVQQKPIQKNSEDEGFSLFEDEYLNEEEFFDDFKRLRIDEQDEDEDESENQSKKQKGGENLIYEFKINEIVQKLKNYQNEVYQKQQNIEHDNDADTQEAKSFSDYDFKEQKVLKIEEINYVEQFLKFSKQIEVIRRINHKNKKILNEKQIKKLLKHSIRKY